MMTNHDYAFHAITDVCMMNCDGRTYLAGIEHKNSVRVDDGVKSVGDDEHGAVGKFFPDCFLDESISSEIDGRSCFIENKNL